jgi:radical SAM family uncharacterized protein/radical SAM-linked protein
MLFPEFDNPLWPLLAQVSRPSRYSGSEWRPSPSSRSSREGSGQGEPLRVCLAFPDVYEIGMSYYGFQVLSPFLSGLPGVLADRAYCPWVDMERLLRERSLPLTSTERSLPLAGFDVVGFTLQHELCYTNVLTMLDLAGIPLRSEARGDGEPIVIAGGPGAFVPEPVAPFFDLFCVGEGEAVLPALLALLRSTRGQKRSERLAQCRAVPGVYVPGDGPAAPVRRQFVRSFDGAGMPGLMVVPSVNIVHDRASLELFRGCSRGCRFCQAGMTARPVRERSPESVTESILNLVRRTGWEEVGLLSLASCDYSAIGQVIDELTPRLTEKGVRLSLPSLRMDGFSVDLAARLREVRRGGLTFAPEAGTQRLRDVINKGIDEDSISACLNEAFSRGWDRVKLYFMMGLPTETEEDLRGIVRLAQSAMKIARRNNRRRASVAVSVAGFVPKAHTPFQWERQNTVEEFKEKGRFLKSQVQPGGGASFERNLTLKYHDPEQSFLEGVLARGDRKTADAIEWAWRRGARFDGWSETFDLTRWLEAFEACGLDPADSTRERGEGESLPWDHIDVGVTRSFLWEERCAAYGERLTPNCRSNCSNCGINCSRGRGPLDPVMGSGEGECTVPPAGREENASTPTNGRAPSPASTAPIMGSRGPRPLVRVFYEKRGGACFVPHVALATVFTRAANRAGIRLCLTDGFSPHAKISFGPELPAGVVALSEPLDVWTEEDGKTGENAPDRLAERWNEQMPEGFRVIKCVFPPEGSPALGKECKAALYWIWARNTDPGELSSSLERHYGEDLLNLAVENEEGVSGFPRISFVVSRPAQNGIGGWVRALTAAGAAAGWQDLRIVRAALGRWNGARMEALAEEGIACLRV